MLQKLTSKYLSLCGEELKNRLDILRVTIGAHLECN
jgi:biotin operon repressor